MFSLSIWKQAKTPISKIQLDLENNILLDSELSIVKTAILGGGLTGITLARFLHEIGEDVTVLEREPVFGGLCRSVINSGFTFDIGGSHIIFSRDKQVLKFMNDSLGRITSAIFAIQKFSIRDSISNNYRIQFSNLRFFILLKCVSLFVTSTLLFSITVAAMRISASLISSPFFLR